MATSIIEKKKYTYEDYLKTPDDVRYELIEGELLMMPAPNARFGVKEYGIAILEGRGVGST